MLEHTQPYKIILGARNTQRTQEAYDALTFDRNANSLAVLPLELNDLKGVRTFANDVQSKLGQDSLDYLLLNAGISNGTQEPGPHGSKWCESLIVNHLCTLSLNPDLEPQLT